VENNSIWRRRNLTTTDYNDSLFFLLFLWHSVSRTLFKNFIILFRILEFLEFSRRPRRMLLLMLLLHLQRATCGGSLIMTRGNPGSSLSPEPWGSMIFHKGSMGYDVLVLFLWWSLSFFLLCCARIVRALSRIWQISCAYAAAAVVPFRGDR
jgi:hypothetical protein